MRKLVLPMLFLGLAAATAVNAAGGPGDAATPPSDDKAAAAPATNLPEAPKPAATTPAPALESQLAELRELLHAQAAEIEAQRRELAEMKAKMGAVKEEAVSASVAASVPAATAAVSNFDPKADPVGADGQGESPLTIHFKGITITPNGFTAAETVYRNRATSSDVNTSFTSIPYSASNLSKISEFNASGRQSRLALKMDGKLSSVALMGYFEGDFLSAGTTSNDNQSNSFTFRQRQFYGSAWFSNGLYVSGGQMWSLVTENKNGLENRMANGSDNMNTPMTIDAQYTAGFAWARQYGLRITDRFFDKKLSLGFSIEEAQNKITQHGGNLNWVAQAPGQAGGLYNPISSVNTANPQVAASQNYTLNPSPDFIFKAAIDPGGPWGHWELLGVVRQFRDRVYPCAVGVTVALPCPVNTAFTTNTAFGANNDTRTGGFGGVNMRLPLFNKHLDVGFHAIYGDGVGRYGTVGLADSTIRPDGTLAPLRGGTGLGSLEWHATKKLDIYGYAGADYVSRGYYLNAFSPNAPVPGLAAGATVSTGVGYGSPTLNNSGCQAAVEVLPNGTAGLPQNASGCTADPRYVLEGTIGFWHRLYSGDKGRVQWGLQYSYVSLNAWSGTTSVPTATSAQFHPHTNDNMFFSSFRYYLP